MMFNAPALFKLNFLNWNFCGNKKNVHAKGDSISILVLLIRFIESYTQSFKEGSLHNKYKTKIVVFYAYAYAFMNNI